MKVIGYRRYTYADGSITLYGMNEAIAKLAAAVGGGDFLNVDSIVDALGLTPGMKVSEFGSGNGNFSMVMAEKVGKDGKVYAIDIQEPPLETLREKVKAMGLENVDALRGNLEVAGGARLPDALLDIVMMANILFQNSKKGEIIKEAKRVLRDGGRLVLIEWKKGAGGFGPPENLRTDEDTFKELAKAEGFNFEQNINAGQYHIGLVFRK